MTEQNEALELYCAQSNSGTVAVLQVPAAPEDFPEFFTESEREVAVGLCQGLSPSCIAERRDVAVSTVHNQTWQMCQKMGVESREELVKILFERASTG